MEHLNKQQTILICLLVAIVTSITTSIATVSLDDKSGQGASQTIYQVIERTEEKVVPDSSPLKKVVEKDTQPKPKELSLSDIADKLGKNIVRIYRKDAAGTSQFITIAVAIGDKGALLGPKTTNIVVEGESLSAVVNSGESYEVTVSKTSLYKDNDVFLVKDAKNVAKFSKVSLGSISSLKLGSNIISFGGKENDDVISTGIVSEFQNIEGANASSTAKEIAVSNLTLSAPISGWILADTSGNILGFAIAKVEGMPAKFIDAAIVKRIGADIF